LKVRATEGHGCGLVELKINDEEKQVKMIEAKGDQY
jgi:hypothetical protein